MSIAGSRRPVRALMTLLIAASLGLAAAACSDDLDPDQALQEGLAQQQAGNPDAAAALYEQVLEVRPGDKFANYNLGVIEQAGGRPALAEGYYRAALDTDPAFTAALFNLAILRTAAGATQEAIDLYLRVIETQPDYAAAHFNLGLLYAGAGKDTLSQASINAALQLDPSLAERLGPDALPAGTEEAAPEASPTA